MQSALLQLALQLRIRRCKFALQADRASSPQSALQSALPLCSWRCYGAAFGTASRLWLRSHHCNPQLVLLQSAPPLCSRRCNSAVGTAVGADGWLTSRRGKTAFGALVGAATRQSAPFQSALLLSSRCCSGRCNRRCNFAVGAAAATRLPKSALQVYIVGALASTATLRSALFSRRYQSSVGAAVGTATSQSAQQPAVQPGSTSRRDNSALNK